MMLKSKIARLKRKGFRDAYVRSHVSSGLAYQIRALREQRGWTQLELAEKLGLKGQSAVARMEDPGYGRFAINSLLKLSSIFDVALSVRFEPYSHFLLEREDVSPSALRAESFELEAERFREDLSRVANFTNLSTATSNSYSMVVELGGIEPSEIASRFPPAITSGSVESEPTVPMFIGKDRTSIAGAHRYLEAENG